MCGLVGIFRIGGQCVKQKAVGFYWTLPVPWAGFTELPDNDIDEACRRSRTIRYQRDICQRHAAAHRLSIIKEVAFLETEPDRGTQYIAGPLERIAPLCREQDALVLFVDFKVLEGWRRNDALHAAASHLDIRLEAVWPDPVIVEGQRFDPVTHFSDWRAHHEAWMARKTERVADALAHALAMRAEGANNPAIAASLNVRGLVSPTGKAWSADNVRKFLKDRSA